MMCASISETAAPATVPGTSATELRTGQAPETAEPQGGRRPWRILQVEDDKAYVMLVGHRLRSVLPPGSTIRAAGTLKAATELLDTARFDVVLLDLTLPDCQGLETLRRVIANRKAPPVLVLSGMEDMDTAMEAMRVGASDFVYKSRLNGQFLVEALQKVVGRGQLEGEAALAGRGVAAEESASRGSANLYSLTRSAVIWPVEADGSPAPALSATTVEMSGKEIVLLAERPRRTLADLAVVGVEHFDRVFRYATVQWTKREENGALVQLAGEFVGRAADPFHESRLSPQFDPQQLTLAPALAAETLRQWTARGLLRPIVIDKVKTCPTCNALPTFRDGCPECGSAHTVTSQMIHHFACAHVAPLSEFEKDGLVCPKCRARNLIVGVDFEHVDGPCKCVECGWSDTERALVGECLRCGLRFVGREAQEREVVQYYVERMDPLALIADLH